MTAAKPIVHIVDDDASFRNAVARLVRTAGYEVRSYSSAVEFLATPPDSAPGCVLLDLHMPGPSGLDLQSALARTANPLPVIFLSGRGDIPSSVQAMRAGAEDFLTKPVDKAELFPALKRALARDERERQQRAHLRELRTRYDTLTPKECEVFAQVVTGKLNKQVAADLDVALITIKVHRAQVMTKMKVESVAELVQVANQLGLLVASGGSSAANQ